MSAEQTGIDRFAETADPLEDSSRGQADFGIEDYSESSLSLYEGDQGTLSLAERRALVELLRHQVLTAERHPREFATVAGPSRLLLSSRLHDLFLDLVVDDERGVAYKTQIRGEGSGNFPALLRDTAYSREATVLLVELRQRHLAERSAGSARVFVDLQDCLDAVERFRPSHAGDVSGDLARAHTAVDSLRAAGVLVSGAEEDRFEITDVIEVILPLERLEELVRRLMELNRPGLATDNASEDSRA